MCCGLCILQFTEILLLIKRCMSTYMGRWRVGVVFFSSIFVSSVLALTSSPFQAGSSTQTLYGPTRLTTSPTASFYIYSFSWGTTTERKKNNNFTATHTSFSHSLLIPRKLKKKEAKIPGRDEGKNMITKRARSLPPTSRAAPYSHSHSPRRSATYWCRSGVERASCCRSSGGGWMAAGTVVRGQCLMPFPDLCFPLLRGKIRDV